MNKLHTLNEKEQREAVYQGLTADGIKVTKTLVDQIMDKQGDLLFNALVAGKGIKIQGVGTVAVAEHKERPFKVPDGKGGFITGTTPAGVHVTFNESDKLLDAMNNVTA